MNLECERVPVIHRVDYAEYVVHILVAVPQEYGITYSTRRLLSPCTLAQAIHDLYSCGCATEIREYLFDT